MAQQEKKRNTFNVDESLDVPFNFSEFKRSGLYVKRYAKLLIGAILLALTSTLLGLLGPIYQQHVIDVCIPNKDIRGLLLTCLLYAVTIGAIIAIARAKALMTSRAGHSIIADIRKDMFIHLQKLPFDYYDSRPHGKILTRIVNYVNSVADFLSNGIVNIVIELLSIVAILFFMIGVNVTLTLYVLAALPIFLIFIVFIKTPQRRAHQRLSNKSSNMNAYLHESINGMKVTQAFDREKKNYEIYDDLSEDVRDAWMRSVYIGSSIWPVILIVSQLVVAVVYFVSAKGIVAGVTVGVAVAFVSYVKRFWQPIQSLGNLFNSLITTTAYLERIFQVLDEPVAIDDVPDAYDLPEIEGRVEFKDVIFGYDAATKVLNHMNFVAQPGESIALVGPTGAGKSTVVSLLARFYDINSGSVTIDGHEIGNVTIASLRSQMGMMLQDTFLFSGTIMENIRYGRLDATDEEVIAAAKRVHADDFIRKLPKGYETEVKERGQSLSAGQRQLVSFARTLLANPRILILDEATSSIDTMTEQLVQQGLQELLKGRTSFIIAHRLSTIRNCRIMYIRDGIVAESGTHEELMAQKGLYYELCTAQMQ